MFCFSKQDTGVSAALRGVDFNNKFDAGQLRIYIPPQADKSLWRKQENRRIMAGWEKRGLLFLVLS
jgi:hypothetical protein